MSKENQGGKFGARRNVRKKKQKTEKKTINVCGSACERVLGFFPSFALPSSKRHGAASDGFTEGAVGGLVIVDQLVNREHASWLVF